MDDKPVNTDLFGNVIIDEQTDVYSHTNKSKQKDLSSLASTQYILEIECTDEKQQEQLYNELTKQGLKINVLTL